MLNKVSYHLHQIEDQREYTRCGDKVGNKTSTPVQSLTDIVILAGFNWMCPPLSPIPFPYHKGKQEDKAKAPFTWRLLL